ncbi:MAG: hypothetical protein QW619_04365 [Candidatus Bathyarchaeia archaeon]|nr:hypothetical protein [Candidatus Bathyarchaeota archaeon]
MVRRRAAIAVVTVSGKAYYKIVNELKSRDVLFLSMIPGEAIPPSIRVVITTEEEKHLINHPNILTYSVEEDPSRIVDEAIRIASGKETYEELVIGVDPGKVFGVAVLGDGKTLKREEFSSMAKALDFILTELNRLPSRVKRVRIGMGVPDVAEKIAYRLESALPKNIIIEMVDEEGTSTSKDVSLARRKLSDADSAVKIALKRGKERQRGVVR